MQKQRDLFLKTEYAAKKPMKRSYYWLKKQLGDYPLAPYAELEYLKHRVFYSSEKQIHSFITRYQGTPLDAPLREKWLRYLAKKNYQKTFLRDYRDLSEADLSCYHLRFQLDQGKPAKEILPQVDKLWIVGKSQPKACDPLFTQWRKQGYQTTDKVWQRLTLAAEGGNHTLIPYLKKLLPQSERYLADLYYKVRRAPSYVSKQGKFPNKNIKETSIVKYGIKRLAWRDRDLALKVWPKLQKKYSFTAEQRNDVIRTLAISLASSNHAKARYWLEQVPADVLDSSLVQWRIADSLRNEEWQTALNILQALPESLQQKESWQYWIARSLQGLGAEAAAQQAFTSLAEKRHYYGFLAAAQVGKKPNFSNVPVKPTAEDIQYVEQLPAMQRAKELFGLKRFTQARREWNFLKSRISKNAKLAAAKISHQWGWYDRAIFTLAEVEYYDDVALRFPLAFQDTVSSYANTHQINPSWAFAITRRESSFMADANSGAGALGLMQIMPNTAKHIAKKRVSRRNLFNPKTNINYGTKYLKQLLNRTEGNVVVATAAYNAGIYRVRKWLPDEEPMPADIWIETIPYKETRDYVKAVMAYRQIYTHLLGQDENIFNDLTNMAIQR